MIREDGACGVEGGIDLRSDWEGGRAGVNMAEGASAGPSTNSEFGSQMIAAACDGNEQELCRILEGSLRILKEFSRILMGFLRDP